jgi:phospholipid/cholesterol/gamma-HCH transport system ATP-binding protein
MPDSPEQNKPKVSVQDLHKSFGKQTVLDGLNLAAGRSETLAVLGRSGTGKSVLLKLIVGLQQPDSGCIQIDGQEVTGLDMDGLNAVRKKIGFLFQQSALYDSLTVAQNVDFVLSRHTDSPEGERKNRVQDLLKSVGLEKDLDKMPSDISGGMQKRVGLARALALDPEILLLDEPTAGLDPITAAEIGQLILKLKAERNLTSVVVTHDVHGARTFADRVILLRDGRVAIEGNFDELQNSDDPFVKHFLKDAA